MTPPVADTSCAISVHWLLPTRFYSNNLFNLFKPSATSGIAGWHIWAHASSLITCLLARFTLGKYEPSELLRLLVEYYEKKKCYFHLII